MDASTIPATPPRRSDDVSDEPRFDRATGLAVLFPGQGSQTPEMREDVERALPDLAALVREEVGDDVFERADQGTRWAQPAIYCAAMAGWDRLRDRLDPDAMAGHSLGEIAALAAAGALSAEDGLRLVAARGRLMQEAAERTGDGGMLAVRARDREALEEVAAASGVTVANDNAPDQVVLSGPVAGIEAAAAALAERGMRATRLPVAAAFHSPSMRDAVEPFREVVESVELHEPSVPVWSCVTGEPFTDVRRQLVESITSPVRWTTVMASLRVHEVGRFVETGPGEVLTRLLRRQARPARREREQKPRARRAPTVPPRPASPPAPAPARAASVVSIGVAVPETVVANDAVAPRMGVTADWIVSRTGVRERRFASVDQRVQDLAAAAGRQALERAGVAAADLDLVLVATMSADESTPNTAPLVAHDLGAVRAGAFDIGSACTGFLAGFAMAAGQIESGRCRHALVIGADVMSRLLDPTDRATAAVFADGAGAVVMGPSDGAGSIGPVVLGADGSGRDMIRVAHEPRLIRMQGHDTFRAAVRRLSEATVEAAERAGVALADIDVFAYHQANSRILKAVGERLGLPSDRVIDCIGRYGNTSSATVPIALEEAAREGSLLPGSTVLVAAFGGGLTWGAGVVRWP